MLAFYIFTSATGMPSYSIALIAGLYFAMPFSSRRYMVYSAVLIASFGFIHILYSSVSDWHSIVYDVGATMAIMTGIFWFNVVERWKSIGVIERQV